MKIDLFQYCDHCWVFQIFWLIECCTLTASSFRIWNSSTGIPSPPLALVIVMLPKAPLTLHSSMSGSRWVITPLWLSGSLRSFFVGEGDDRRWDGWMTSLTQWTWVWVNYGNGWWTGRPGVLQFMGLQRVRHDEPLNWTELTVYSIYYMLCISYPRQYEVFI